MTPSEPTRPAPPAPRAELEHLQDIRKELLAIGKEATETARRLREAPKFEAAGDALRSIHGVVTRAISEGTKVSPRDPLESDLLRWIVERCEGVMSQW
jgi:hypothetical protein